MAVTTFAVVGLATACGSDAASPGTQSALVGTPAVQAGHAGQDVTFARRMIPYLSDARDLAKLVAPRSTNSAVLELAARIMRSQNPDIQQLMRWLLEWGEEYEPNTDNEAVQELQQVEDAQFDRVWTQMTIELHERAIALAKTELENGTNSEAKQFAQKIIDTRRAEIEEMRRLTPS